MMLPVRILVFGLCLCAVGVQAADDSLLITAVKNGDRAEIELLLVKGADVNAKDKDKNADGHTPLHWAVYGKKDIAELLLARGADVNAKDMRGDSPLHRAAFGAKDLVELLLTKGADVNARNKFGETPLHFAVGAGKKDVAELLLARGADVNAKDNSWITPLWTALILGQDDIIDWLLAKGADIKAKDKKGNTPLQWAEIAGWNDTVMMLEELMLKQAGSNPRTALVQLTKQLKDDPHDRDVRRLIIKLADELKPAPAIPEEARKHFVEGTAIVKAAKNPAQLALASQSFTEALKIAPWWGDAYYNLGVAQELAEQFDKAEQAFTFYLLSNPGEAEKREVQDRIYALSAKRKLSGAK